jgi:aspartyl-tRNA(Asn)/glutamyl-tRNA(Gln) amidotransferase subunit C
MSTIDRDAIRHLERLARIDLAPDEVGPITEQLNRIVALVEQLQAVDVEGVEPTRAMVLAGPEPADDVRDDVVTPGLDRATVLSQAPDATPEFFRVPRVIGKADEA